MWAKPFLILLSAKGESSPFSTTRSRSNSSHKGLRSEFRNRRRKRDCSVSRQPGIMSLKMNLLTQPSPRQSPSSRATDLASSQNFSGSRGETGETGSTVDPTPELVRNRSRFFWHGSQVTTLSPPEYACLPKTHAGNLVRFDTLEEAVTAAGFSAGAVMIVNGKEVDTSIPGGPARRSGQQSSRSSDQRRKDSFWLGIQMMSIRMPLIIRAIIQTRSRLSQAVLRIANPNFSYTNSAIISATNRCPRL